MILTNNTSRQTGESIKNNIQINNEDLDKGVLRIRYSNNRKLTNNILKDDYKISKRMVNAIEFNKNIHKLSNNDNVSDINQIIDDTIQEKFNITEKPIKLSVDVNRYAILIIAEENWELQLDRNFMNLFGFSNSNLTEGYNR